MNLGTESGTVGFEENMTLLDRGVLSLTAMLNTHRHGTLYLGVDDRGDVVGIDVSPDTIDTIKNRISDLVKGSVEPTISVLTSDDGKKYVSVDVSGYDIPYSFDGRYYIRNVSSNESAGPEVLVRLVMSRGIDPLKGQASDVQDLTFETFFGIMTARGLHPRNDDGFYRSHWMKDEKGLFNLTAYLVSDQFATPMQVVRFNGRNRTAVSSRTDFGGQSLIASTRTVLEHIASYMVTEVDMSGGERRERNLFDFDAFREAWVNACVHNSWRSMVPPSVMMFDDRIEVVSYGGIPFPASLEDFYRGDSRPVNRSLFELFTLAGLTEQSGHGVPTIVGRYGREAFHITDSGVTVTIPFSFEPDYIKARRETERRRAGLDPELAGVLDRLAADPDAKLSDVASETGMSLSSVKKAVSRLKSEGLLRNDGTNRNSRWVVL